MEKQELQINLQKWTEESRKYSEKGKCANYIPALANCNPRDLGICLMAPDGEKLTAGESQFPFTLQSISKIFSFISVCMALGIDSVLEKVDVEPTGDPFNSIIRLEAHKPGKPFNPMINAGAITVTSLLSGTTPTKKVDGLLDFLEQMIGRRPVVNQDVFESEWQTAHRNRALAYYLKATGYIESNVEEALEVYLKQCSIEVHAEDLAEMGLVLSHDGYHPIQRKQIIPPDVSRVTKALMLTCGMYNASGKFAAFVGVPAKSGVSGGIIAVVPGRGRGSFPKGCGIGVYGPAIDEIGNSSAGVALLRKLAEEWEMGIF